MAGTSRVLELGVPLEATAQRDDSANTFDGWGRITHTTNGAHAGGSEDFSYDGLGRRVYAQADAGVDHSVGESTVSDDETVTEHYTYDLAGHLIYTRRFITHAGTNTADTTRYIWSGADSALIRRDRTTGGGGGTTVKLYALTDWQHNVMAVVNGGGAVQERYTYDAFGKVQVRAADWTVDGEWDLRSQRLTYMLAFTVGKCGTC